MTDQHTEQTDHDTDMWRHCTRCDLTRHGDCKPSGCAATRD